MEPYEPAKLRLSSSILIQDSPEYQQLLLIQSSIRAAGPVDESILTLPDAPGRRFLREGKLKKVCRKQNKTRYFWLFSDLLVQGCENFEGQHKFNRSFPLAMVRVEPVVEDKHQCSFIILR
jgi:hypothetical protein